MTEKLSYTEAISELESIVSEIEQDDIPVDELLEKVKRSSELLAFCKEKLVKTEDEVQHILKDMDAEEKDVSSADSPEQEMSEQE